MSKSRADEMGKPAAGFGLTVLQVVPRLDTGGVERGVVDVASAIVAAGGRAVVASAGGSLIHELDRAGATHVSLPVHSKNPYTMWRNIARLAAAIAEHEPNVVHARSRAPAWSARAAARRAGVPFVTTFHGVYNFANPWKRRYNAVMAAGDRVIAISEFVRAHAIAAYGADPARIDVIHRGIDTARFDPTAVPPARMAELARTWRLPDDRAVVMLPGRLTRWKGQEVFLDALARLGRDDVVAVLVGSDQGRTGYSAALAAQVRTRGLEGRVWFVGHCADMPAAFMLSDVVVSASTDPEAFGRVIVEAQAMGRPVVATDHGGARETVIPGETGWLVPPGDPDALARAIERALALTVAEREKIARTASRHARETYSRERMCADTLDVYRRVAASASESSPLQSPPRSRAAL